LCDGGRRLLQNRVTKLYDGIDHLEASQLFAISFEVSLEFQY
jgi:hypothetical protein